MDPENLEYLKAVREENKAWTADFRKRYGIVPQQRTCDTVQPDDWYEVHSHHAEYGSAAH